MRSINVRTVGGVTRWNIKFKSFPLTLSEDDKIYVITVSIGAISSIPLSIANISLWNVEFLFSFQCSWLNWTSYSSHHMKIYLNSECDAVSFFLVLCAKEKQTVRKPFQTQSSIEWWWEIVCLALNRRHALGWMRFAIRIRYVFFRLFFFFFKRQSFNSFPCRHTKPYHLRHARQRKNACHCWNKWDSWWKSIEKVLCQCKGVRMLFFPLVSMKLHIIDVSHSIKLHICCGKLVWHSSHMKYVNMRQFNHGWLCHVTRKFV